MHSDTRHWFAPEHQTTYPQQQSLSGTPSTVRSMARDPRDSTTAMSANMELKPSYQGYLTDEQKASRDSVKRQL